MKSILLFVNVCLLSISVLAQKEISMNDWATGQSKKIYAHTIQKSSGTHSASNFLNLSFQSAEEMIEKVKEDAKKGNWEKSKTNLKLDEYRVHNKGGLVQLYLVRSKEGEANTANFTVYILKDGKELQKKTLVSAAAKKSTTYAPNYENQNFAWIKNEVAVPFEIHVEEKGSIGPSIWHKFMIVD